MRNKCLLALLLFLVVGCTAASAQSTTTALTATPTSTVPGATVALSATVQGAAPVTVIPQGTVNFKDGQQAIGTAKLASANLVSPALVPGTQITGSVDRRAACLLATGDINADGNTDLLSYCGGFFQVFLAAGPGQYRAQPAQAYTGLAPFFEPVLLDMNGDGKVDIALPGDTTLTVLYGNGAGLFAAPAAFPSVAAQTIGSFSMDYQGDLFRNAISALGSADLDGDGRNDLIVGELKNSTTAGNLSEVVSVYKNHGGGIFTYMGSAALEDSTTSFGITMLPGTVRSFAFADVTGDARPDVVAAYDYVKNTTASQNGQPAAKIGILVNDGTGALTVASRIAAPCGGLGIGCTPCDIASSTTVGGPNSSTVCGPSIVTGDFAARGKTDLVISGETINSIGNVSVYPGNGDGTFGAAHSFSSVAAAPAANPRITGRYAALVATDFDRDGKLDLLDSLGYVYLGNGDFTFASQGFGTAPNLLGYQYGVTNWNGGIVDQLFMMDFDGDGIADFYFQSGPSDGKPLFLLGSNAALASFATKPAIGTHSMTATYAGAGSFTGSTSSAVTVTVAKQSPTITGSALPASAPVTQAITLSVKVTATSVAPTGTVNFTMGTMTLGTANLDASGNASISYTFTTVGTQTVTASYGGDANTAGGTGTITATTVNALSLSTSTGSTTLSTSRGGTATSSLSAASQNGFSGTVAFACGGLPAGVTCAFSPASVSVSGTAPGTTTLTVSVSSTVSMLRTLRGDGGCLMLAGVGLLCIAGAARRRRIVSSTLLALAVSVAVVGAAGCGGGGGGSSSNTAKSYTFNVTATSGTAQTSIAYALNVQ